MSDIPFRVYLAKDADDLEKHLNAMFIEGRIPMNGGIIPIVGSTLYHVLAITIPAEVAETIEKNRDTVDMAALAYMRKKGFGNPGDGGAFN
jgi:hypothetical protein